MKSWLLMAAIATAACASTTTTTQDPPAAAADASGIYDFNTTVDGNAVTGTVTITRSGNAYGGTVTTNITDPIDISAVTMEGNQITVMAITPDGPITFVMNFTGDDFTGTWALGTMSGTHTGKRRTG
jgi:hypothetical protein